MSIKRPKLGKGQSSGRPKKVGITGVNGFLAAALAELLVKKGAKVYGFVRSRKRPQTSLGFRQEVRDQITIIPIDFCKGSNALRDTLAAENITQLFHLAATSTVGEAGRAIPAALKNNIIGAMHVLEACRSAGTVEELVVSTSDKAYGPADRLPYTEDMPLRPGGVYEVSKSCEDQITQMYFKQGLPVRIARCANLYGPGDLHYSRLIPGTIARLLTGRPPFVRAGQDQVLREYIYVEDVARALLAIAESIKTATVCRRDPSWKCAYNVGSDEKFNPLQVIDAVQNLMGTTMEPEIQPAAETSLQELPSQYLDTTKLREETGFNTTVDFKQGLAQTVEWYVEHRVELGLGESWRPANESTAAETDKAGIGNRTASAV